MKQLINRILSEEGLTTFMYLDTAEPPVVTVGVGHALSNVEAALKLPWDQPESQVRVDFAAVLSAPRGYRAAFYEQFSKSRLSEAFVRELLEREIDEQIFVVKTYFSGYDSFPEPARIAIADMAFNLGGGFPRKFPSFTAAVLQGNWDRAAEHCHRSGIAEERNEKTAALLRQAALEREAV
jgi:GH24 family phage-related lysozyme (muramidase)